jgi:hypothetical protein
MTEALYVYTLGMVVAGIMLALILITFPKGPQK